MENAVLNILAGLAMLVMASHHDNELVFGLSLLFVGLVFMRPIASKRQAFALVLIGISGPLMLLGYNFWQFLPNISGILLIFSAFSCKRDFLSFLELMIGLSWCFIDVPIMCSISGTLMIIYGATQIFLGTIGVLNETFSSTS